jgi:hypothetical protein
MSIVEIRCFFHVKRRTKNEKENFQERNGGLLAVLTAFTTLIGMGTTAFAASETAESYMVSYPRDGDAVQVYDHSTWGHDAKTYMNGWSTGASDSDYYPLYGFL